MSFASVIAKLYNPGYKKQGLTITDEKQHARHIVTHLIVGVGLMILGECMKAYAKEKEQEAADQAVVDEFKRNNPDVYDRSMTRMQRRARVSIGLDKPATAITAIDEPHRFYLMLDTGLLLERPDGSLHSYGTVMPFSANELTVKNPGSKIVSARPDEAIDFQKGVRKAFALLEATMDARKKESKEPRYYYFQLADGSLGDYGSGTPVGLINTDSWDTQFLIHPDGKLVSMTQAEAQAYQDKWKSSVKNIPAFVMSYIKGV